MDFALQIFSSPRLAAAIATFTDKDESGAPTRYPAEAWILSLEREKVVGQRYTIDDPHAGGYGQPPGHFLADRAHAWVERKAFELGVVLRDCPSNYYSSRDKRADATVALLRLAFDAPGLVDQVALTTECAELEAVASDAMARSGSVKIVGIEQASE
jgi:hypothetical protein